MFESYYIQLKYRYPTIIIHLIEYTGLRYNILDIYVRKSGDLYYCDKKYERYI